MAMIWVYGNLRVTSQSLGSRVRSLTLTRPSTDRCEDGSRRE